MVRLARVVLFLLTAMLLSSCAGVGKSPSSSGSGNTPPPPVTGGGGGSTGSANGQNCTGSAPVIDSGPNVTVNSPTSVTIAWTTTGYNSSSLVMYGNDGNTLGQPGPGGNWVHRDTVTGVAKHSVTLTGLDGDNQRQNFGVASYCFTNGVPDVSLVASIPHGYQTSATSYFNTASPNITQNTLEWVHRIPPPAQDGMHKGFHVRPGYGTVIPYFYFLTTIPSAGYHFGNGLIVTMSGSIFSNFSLSGYYTDAYSNRIAWTASPNLSVKLTAMPDSHATGTPVGAAFDVRIPADVPTSGSGCTNAGGTDLGSSKGCAYPVTIHSASADARCGSTWTCTSPPDLSFYLIVWNEPTFPYGSVSQSFPACTTTLRTNCVPCVKEEAKGASYDNCSYQATNQSYNGSFYSWEGQWGTPVQQGSSWGQYWGNDGAITDGSGAQASFFYNGAYTLKKAGDYFSLASTFYPLAQNSFHHYRDHNYFPIVYDHNSFTVTAVSNSWGTNTTCNAIQGYHNSGNIVCGTFTVDCGACNLSSLQSGLASGYTYVATVSVSGYPGTVHILSSSGSTFTLESEPSPNWGNDCIATPTNCNTEAAGYVFTIQREINNLPAQSGSGGTTLIFDSSVDLSDVPPTGPRNPVVAYIVTGVSPNWSKSTQIGAQVTGCNNAMHTCTLSTSLPNLTSGSQVQIRKYVVPSQIYVWPEAAMDQYQRNGDYTALDFANALTLNPSVPMFYATPDYQRELSLLIDACRLARTYAGVSTAVTPSTLCTDSSLNGTLYDQMQAMMDYVINNPPAADASRQGPLSESMLAGLQAWSLVNCIEDKNYGCSNDPRWPYWVKALADYAAPRWDAYPTHYKQWAYNFEYPDIGIFFWYGGDAIVIDGVERTAYQPEQALLNPVYAWLYYKTGDGVIPTLPSRHYSDFFNETFRYLTIYGQTAFSMHGKTLGQQYLWTSDALTWMGTAP